MNAIVKDRPAYFSDFFREFFNIDVLLGERISNYAIQASWNVAAGASAKGTLDCVPSWLTDFRDDLPRIDIEEFSEKVRKVGWTIFNDRVHNAIENTLLNPFRIIISL
jgi:hypothetical protein